MIALLLIFLFYLLSITSSLTDPSLEDSSNITSLPFTSRTTRGPVPSPKMVNRSTVNNKMAYFSFNLHLLGQTKLYAGASSLVCNEMINHLLLNSVVSSPSLTRRVSLLSSSSASLTVSPSPPVSPLPSHPPSLSPPSGPLPPSPVPVPVPVFSCRENIRASPHGEVVMNRWNSIPSLSLKA